MKDQNKQCIPSGLFESCDRFSVEIWETFPYIFFDAFWQFPSIATRKDTMNYPREFPVTEETALFVMSPPHKCSELRHDSNT
jgi:hypothetical protein